MAVNVTDCPASEGFTDEVTAVVVAGFVKFAVTDCACDMVTVVLAEFGLANIAGPVDEGDTGIGSGGLTERPY